MTEIPEIFEQYSFDASVPPAAAVRSGDAAVFCCQDCYARQIDEDGKDYTLLDMHRNNPMTGPLFIEGAEPGDILRVDILSIRTENYGTMCLRTGAGLYEMEECCCRRFPIEGGMILFDRDVRIPVSPMIGIIGTCPADEAVSSQTPGEHGGNLDICELREGSTICLPVYVPGAMLFLGDLHAVQGDGETAICAMETSGRVTVRVKVLSGADLPTPFLVTEESVFTTAADPSLDFCSRAAAEKMHGWLMRTYGLSDVQAALLLSLQGRLRIAQVVNPKKGCMMELPRSILRQLGEERF